MDESPSQKNLRISTSGVDLMTSMDEITSSCSTEHSNPMANYEKSGYKLCSYVDKFIKTHVEFIHVIKPSLDKGGKNASCGNGGCC